MGVLLRLAGDTPAERLPPAFVSRCGWTLPDLGYVAAPTPFSLGRPRCPGETVLGRGSAGTIALARPRPRLRRLHPAKAGRRDSCPVMSSWCAATSGGSTATPGSSPAAARRGP